MKRAVVIAALVVAVLLVALVVVVVADGDDDTDTVAPPTTRGTTTTTTTTLPPGAGEGSVESWPFAGDDTTFDDPVDAARSFAVTYLRFRDPVVGEFQQGDSRSGEVEVRPTGNGPATTILVRRLTNDESWSVLGAATGNIDVTSPGAGDEIGSPARVTGRAVAFEGNVQVEVRQDGELGPIGEGFVTGGGDAMRPFEGAIPFETPGEPYGALVLFTESAENGQVWEAVAIRVRLRSTDVDAAACGDYRSPRYDPGPDEMEVKAYFNCDLDSAPTGGAGVSLHPVFRLVPKSSGVLGASLTALLRGPTEAERAVSISSWFSEETAGMLRSVRVGADGHAVVDFDDLREVIPNASSSAGSALLLSQLDATVFQFRSVESVEYRLDGDCEAFSEWLQYGGCEKRTREVSSD